MWGICGIMFTKPGSFGVGSILYQMMESQQIRAQDSTGVAIYDIKSSRKNKICIANDRSDKNDDDNNIGSSDQTFKIGYLEKSHNDGFKNFKDQVPAKDVEVFLEKLRQNPMF